MVYGCYAPRLDYRVHVSLQRLDYPASINRLDYTRNPHTIDMDGRIAPIQTDTDLLSRHHQGLAKTAPASAIVQQRQVIVVAQHQEVVPMPPVPADDLVRVLVTV